VSRTFSARIAIRMWIPRAVPTLSRGVGALRPESVFPSVRGTYRFGAQRRDSTLACNAQKWHAQMEVALERARKGELSSAQIERRDTPGR
jgi:hypothetical protein